MVMMNGSHVGSVSSVSIATLFNTVIGLLVLLP